MYTHGISQMIKLPQNKKKLEYNEIPPKWFKILTVVLAALLLIYFTWVVTSISGCSNQSQMVEYAKARHPGCGVVKVSDEPCGTKIVFQCPYTDFREVCLAKRK